MKCPVDEAELVMKERQGVGIDYCPQCRGVWLDRGELEKILDRDADEADRRNPAGVPPEYRDRYESGRRRQKRHSWLNDLFD
jgi:uncharacterized protein